MSQLSALSLPKHVAASQEWWDIAGVSHDFSDDGEAWLADEQEEALKLATPVKQDAKKPSREAEQKVDAPQLGGEPESWPKDLTPFRKFWLEEPSLDDGGTHPRIASRGDAGAKLLVLVPMPEAEDTEKLLSSRHGTLVANMVSAMGFAEDEVSIIAALPRHIASPDWHGLGERGLGALLVQQISLAAPKQLIVLGRSVLPLLGHDPAQAPATITKTSIQGAELPSLIGFAPERLLQHAKSRAGLWKRWLEWTGSQ